MPQALPMAGPRFGTAATVSSRSAGSETPSLHGVGGRVPSSRGGLLRLVSPGQLQEQEERQNASRRELPAEMPQLARLVTDRWYLMRDGRNTTADPIGDRLIRAQRMFHGRYDPDKLQAIRRFGGSEVYARIVAVKCRGSTSLLRDVYLGSDRPWDIEAERDPPVPPEVRASIMQLVAVEAQAAAMAGQPPSPDSVYMRTLQLSYGAQQAARAQAQTQARVATSRIDDLLIEGNFYQALAAFLVDLPLFPFAVMKGPVVRIVPRVVWQDRKPIRRPKPTMFWERISPFDFYWTPGASNIEDAETCERRKVTRADLNELIGLPGYNDEAIRAVLEDYGRGGLRDWLDTTDSERAMNEGREDPNTNRSGMIDTIEFHGRVQGSMLLEYGLPRDMVPDEERDYSVQAWQIGRYTIKVQLSPSPRERIPYFVTSYEKVPGTIAGHGLPDILEDLQEVQNATLRALVNNVSIASGPQVVINDDRLSETETGDDLYPWKRWHVQDDPAANSRDPVSFFQPGSNAQELLGVYKELSTIADEISAIPRYITGGSNLAGAGRTASGLSMLMNNASKVLQTVAANVDVDVMDPMLSMLYDMIMLTDDTGMLTGGETIKVMGVNVAVQRETERQKQLQFLQITANPIDTEIIGLDGRARVLRAVSENLGLPDNVVPDDDAMKKKIAAQQRMAAAMQSAGGAPSPPGGPGPPGEGPQALPMNDGTSKSQGGQNTPQPGPSSPGGQAPSPQNDMQPGAGGGAPPP